MLCWSLAANSLPRPPDVHTSHPSGDNSDNAQPSAKNEDDAHPQKKVTVTPQQLAQNESSCLSKSLQSCKFFVSCWRRLRLPLVLVIVGTVRMSSIKIREEQAHTQLQGLPDS